MRPYSVAVLCHPRRVMAACVSRASESILGIGVPPDPFLKSRGVN